MLRSLHVPVYILKCQMAGEIGVLIYRCLKSVVSQTMSIQIIVLQTKPDQSVYYTKPDQSAVYQTNKIKVFN